MPARPFSAYLADFSDYIPESVKTAAGISRQLHDEVRHLTAAKIQAVAHYPGGHRAVYLLLGYTDGYQVWDATQPELKEVSSKQDKPVSLLALLPRAEPALLTVRKTSPKEVRVYKLATNESVWLLRLVAPVTGLEATASTIVVESTGQVDVHDGETYDRRFTVQTCGTPNVFALGARWLAYRMSAARVPRSIWARLGRLGEGAQHALDTLWMAHCADAQTAIATSHGEYRGAVCVRDLYSGHVVTCIEDDEVLHHMAFSPSGTLLVSCTGMGHTILVHRAVGSPQGATVRLERIHTFHRGVTPALVSEMVVSDDERYVAVGTAKGTVHLLELPKDDQAEVTCTRIHLGSSLLQEGLLPTCGFVGKTLLVSTRAGVLNAFELPSSTAAWSVPVCRSQGTFPERSCFRPTSAKSSTDERWLAQVEGGDAHDALTVWRSPQFACYELLDPGEEANRAARYGRPLRRRRLKLAPESAGALSGEEISQQITGALENALPIAPRSHEDEFVVTPAEDGGGFYLAERRVPA